MDNVGVELLIEKTKFILITTYLHPIDRSRRRATLINLLDNINNI